MIYDDTLLLCNNFGIRNTIFPINFNQKMIYYRYISNRIIRMNRSKGSNFQKFYTKWKVLPQILLSMTNIREILVNRVFYYINTVRITG